jgi:hypothetical protein
MPKSAGGAEPYKVFLTLLAAFGWHRIEPRMVKKLGVARAEA